MCLNELPCFIARNTGSRFLVAIGLHHSLFSLDRAHFRDVSASGVDFLGNNNLTAKDSQKDCTLHETRFLSVINNFYD